MSCTAHVNLSHCANVWTDQDPADRDHFIAIFGESLTDEVAREIGDDARVSVALNLSRKQAEAVYADLGVLLGHGA